MAFVASSVGARPWADTASAQQSIKAVKTANL
jgi:hypothetical protein